MPTTGDFIDGQEQVGNIIKQAFSNFRKDSASRKNLEYVQSRIKTLDSTWEDFKNRHDIITQMAAQDIDSKSDTYFTNNYYGEIQSEYNSYMKRLVQLEEEISRKPALSRGTNDDNQLPTNMNESQQQIQTQIQQMQQQFQEQIHKQNLLIQQLMNPTMASTAPQTSPVHGSLPPYPEPYPMVNPIPNPGINQAPQPGLHNRYMVNQLPAYHKCKYPNSRGRKGMAYVSQCISNIDT